MPTIYLRSTDGNDADDGSTWALAKATLAAALTAAGAGGTVNVSQAHAESLGAGITLTSPGTLASPVIVQCVNDGAEPPTTPATGASVATSSGSIEFRGVAYSRGVLYRITSTSAITFLTTAVDWTFEDGELELGNTGSSLNRFRFGGTSGATSDEMRVKLVNSILRFAHTGNFIDEIGNLLMRGGSVTGAAATTLLDPTSTTKSSKARFEGVDLSNLTGTLVGTPASTSRLEIVFHGCKLGGGVTPFAGSWPSRGCGFVELINCDSADTITRYYHDTYEGVTTHETTIVKTSGASDGTTPFSRKMVSGANVSFMFPMELPRPCFVWNETTGSPITLTVEIVNDGLTLDDDEVWLEAFYPGTSGFPLHALASDRVASVLATPAAQASSSVPWTTTGLSSPVKQALSVTVTPEEKGPIFLRVMLARPSTTIYVDQKATVS